MHNAEIINKQIIKSSNLNNMTQLGLGCTMTQAGFNTPVSAVTGFSTTEARRELQRGSPSHPTSKLLCAEHHTAAGLIWKQTTAIDAIRSRFVCLLCTTSFHHTCSFYWDSSCCRLWAPHNRNGVGKVAVHTVSWHSSLQIPGLYDFFLICLSSCCICSQEYSVPMPCLHQPPAKPQQCSRTTRRFQELRVSSHCFLSCGTELDSSITNVGTTFIALFVSGNMQNLLLSSYQA